MDLDANEQRVVGCLVEKQRTTPDVYPLSLNALRLACNQSTNRDPVMELTEDQVREALIGLGKRRYTRLTSGPGARTGKYRHLLDEALDLADDELALLAVLLLRGAQTPGELNQRAARLHGFASLDALEETLERLVSRDLAVRQERRPGQKEQRYAHLLGRGEEAVERAAPAAPRATETQPAPADDVADDGLAARVDLLEREVAELRDHVSQLRAALGE